MYMLPILAIGIGGFFGAISRFLVSRWMFLMLGPSFPYGTLTVNAIGSFLLGFLSLYFSKNFAIGELPVIGILVGFLGAFTTFSTFSYESILFFQEGNLLKAGINILGNCLICLTLCFAGVYLAKS